MKSGWKMKILMKLKKNNLNLKNMLLFFTLGSLNPKQAIREKFTAVVCRTVQTFREFHGKIQNMNDGEM